MVRKWQTTRFAERRGGSLVEWFGGRGAGGRQLQAAAGGERAAARDWGQCYPGAEARTAEGQGWAPLHHLQEAAGGQRAASGQLGGREVEPAREPPDELRVGWQEEQGGGAGGPSCGGGPGETCLTWVALVEPSVSLLHALERGAVDVLDLRRKSKGGCVYVGNGRACVRDGSVGSRARKVQEHLLSDGRESAGEEGALDRVGEEGEVGEDAEAAEGLNHKGIPSEVVLGRGHGGKGQT